MLRGASRAQRRRLRKLPPECNISAYFASCKGPILRLCLSTSRDVDSAASQWLVLSNRALSFPRALCVNLFLSLRVKIFVLNSLSPTHQLFTCFTYSST